MGEYRLGKKHGKGTYTMKDGTRYEGDFKDGAFPHPPFLRPPPPFWRHGEWPVAPPPSVPTLTEYCHFLRPAGKPNGKGMYVWANGDVYTGEFENDEFHGHGSWSSASGEHYEGGTRSRAIYYAPLTLAHSIVPELSVARFFRAPNRRRCLLLLRPPSQNLYMVSGMAGAPSVARLGIDMKVCHVSPIIVTPPRPFVYVVGG